MLISLSNKNMSKIKMYNFKVYNILRNVSSKHLLNNRSQTNHAVVKISIFSHMLSHSKLFELEAVVDFFKVLTGFDPIHHECTCQLVLKALLR